MNNYSIDIISRGYYVRMKAMDTVSSTFLKINPEEKKQVLILGAGWDTTYFRLHSLGFTKNAKFIEV